MQLSFKFNVSGNSFITFVVVKLLVQKFFYSGVNYFSRLLFSNYLPEIFINNYQAKFYSTLDCRFGIFYLQNKILILYSSFIGTLVRQRKWPCKRRKFFTSTFCSLPHQRFPGLVIITLKYQKSMLMKIFPNNLMLETLLTSAVYTCVFSSHFFFTLSHLIINK